jgi:hypothetical protein
VSTVPITVLAIAVKRRVRESNDNNSEKIDELQIAGTLLSHCTYTAETANMKGKSCSWAMGCNQYHLVVLAMMQCNKGVMKDMFLSPRLLFIEVHIYN